MLSDYRSRFGFSTGTTSFILHDTEDNLIKNCDYLKDKADEVQLLYFGKNYLDEMLTPAILDRLKSIRNESGLTYSLHLPIDLGFLAPGDESLQIKTESIYRIVDKTAFLDIRHYVIHLDRSLGFKAEAGKPLSPLLNPFETERLDQSIRLLKSGLGNHFSRFCLENTDYDLTSVKSIVDQYELSICLDFGHLELLNLPLRNFLQSFNSRIQMAHIHGFQGGKDHQSLNDSPQVYLSGIISFLSSFTGTAIIEVFSEQHLSDSLAYLDLELPSIKKI